jgi:hypothetical protein
LPSQGFDISIRDILRCKEGNGDLVFDTVSPQVVCALDFSFFAFVPLRLSDDEAPGAETPIVAPFKAMLPDSKLKRQKTGTSHNNQLSTRSSMKLLKEKLA